MSSHIVTPHLFNLSPPVKKPHATIQLPGSKSYTNRALVMASLAAGSSTLSGASLSDDSEALCTALRLLGVTIEKAGDDQLKISGRGKFAPYKGTIDVGPAGTTMRFLVPLCAFTPGCEVTLKGSERMHKRPIQDLVEALQKLGADIKYLGSKGCPPLAIRGVAAPAQAAVSMDGTTSSQFFSSILLAAPLFSAGLKITVKGQQASRSYIDMTIDSMRQFGVTVHNKNYTEYSTEPERAYNAQAYRVEGDASGASYFFGMAAISGGEVRVNNLNPYSVQGDVNFPKLLVEMGCDLNSGDDKGGWISIRGPKQLQAIEADMTLMPDTAQTLAVVAASAEGTSYISGLSTLKIKETDRIEALKTELAKLGVESSTSADSISVEGKANRTITPATIATYEDHRMAMAFAVLAARFRGIAIADPAVVNKSFPTFWTVLEKLGVTIAKS